jgi:MFS family permease
MILADSIIPSPYLIFIFSFVSGMCAGLFPVSYAYVVDVSATEKRSANFGLLGNVTYI